MGKKRISVAYLRFLISEELFSAKCVAILFIMLALCMIIFYPVTIHLINEHTVAGYWEMLGTLLGSYWFYECCLIGGILLISGIPYMGKEAPYYLLRGKKKDWVLGNVCFLLMTSLLFYGGIALFTLLFLLPGVTFQNEWSSEYEELANGISDFSVKAGNWLTFQNLSDINFSGRPLEFVAWLIVLSILCLFVMGMLILYFSVMGKKKTGIAITISLIVLDGAVTGFENMAGMKSVTVLNYLNPVSFIKSAWIPSELLQQAGNQMYGLLFDLTVIVLLVLGTFRKMKKTDWVSE